jgi:eukaryotic-like serine/threonine-protein kinase
MTYSPYELDQLLEKWEDLHEQGTPVEPARLTDDAELAKALVDRVRQIQEMDWLDQDRETIDLSLSKLSTGIKSDAKFQQCVPWLLGNRYTLECMIAGGGFGQVWKAWDRHLERHVAVKLSQIDNSVEARHVARLQHPGIVAVHDLGKEQETWYIVFDLIEGVDLGKRIESDPLLWWQSVEVVAKVADALDYAHKRGFVHRDVKPANILVKEDGTPVLADFGIAVTEGEMKGETATTAGTLAYMAPELLVGDGKQADVCTDIYGLGVVLYQSLSGSLPFKGRNFFEVRQRILSGEMPKCPETCHTVPEELKQIILRCLHKDPDMRFQSASELAATLRSFLKPYCDKAKKA